MLSSRLTELQLADAPAALPKQSCGVCARVRLLFCFVNLTVSPCQPPARKCSTLADLLSPALAALICTAALSVLLCIYHTALTRRDRFTVALAAVEDSMQGDVSVFGATDWFDITDYQLLDEEDSGVGHQLADACSSAASECLGLVLREDASRVQSKVHLSSASVSWLTGVAVIGRCFIDLLSYAVHMQEEVSPMSKRRTRKVSLLAQQLQHSQAVPSCLWKADLARCRCVSPAICAVRLAPRR